ncbi:MAG: sigma-54-dependent Fis family transcriptional regulator, partial [Thermodesulfobacteriota bacterium]|nr:sigma-54-dependent Fis family transcriptional regulator [Thermodesulfobacteriota bacterium]
SIWELLCNYAWPGNVRELKNLVERLAIMAGKDVIDVADIPAPYNPGVGEGMESIESELFLIDNFKGAVEVFEKAFIKRKLLQYNNNITKTAEAIGVKRGYLSGKLKKMN